MIHLVTGGSGSGKSAYAEDWLVTMAQAEAEHPLLYIATMRPYGEETLAKIERHQRLRAGKGFRTLECYGALQGIAEDRQFSGILLECMSNHLLNLLYTEEGKLRDPKLAREEILQGIRHLADHAGYLAVVTNEIHSDLGEYSEETRIYIQLLGEINQELGTLADQVTEVVYGIPVSIKS